MSSGTQNFDAALGGNLPASRGEMAERTRAFDWDRTPVGPPRFWPRSLRTVLNLMLSSQHPMFLWWGPELVQFYNDGYRPSLGDDRHPNALGASGRTFWSEIWPAIGPQIEAVMERGDSTWNVDHFVPISRNHRVEEVYWTYGYSPVLDDDGSIGGTLVIVQETTDRVVSERRMRLLQSLADQFAVHPQTSAEIYRLTSDLLSNYDADVSFALLYERDADGHALQLVARVGCSDELSVRETVDLGAPRSPGETWPFQSVVSSQQTELVNDLAARFATVPGGRWPEPAPGALLLPIEAPGQAGVAGVLVAGLSPRLPFDEGYREFLRLVTGQIGNALASAQLRQQEQATREQLEHLFEHAPSAIALLSGPDQVFTLANQCYLDLTGRHDVIGKSVREVFPELQNQGIYELLHQVYTTGQPFIADQMPLQLDLQGDGVLETLFLDFVYAPMYGRSRTITGIFVHAYDVTDQVKARQTAEAAIRARDEFLSIASHELRNPVAGIKGTAQLLCRLARSGRLDAERLERYVTSIEAGTNRLTTLIEDLLDVTRLQQGALLLRLRMTDLAALTREVAARLPHPGRQQVAIAIGEAIRPAMMDPDRIEQILVNMLDNAVKYSQGHGQILVSVRQDPSGTELRVQDHGIGLPEGMTERIFQPFGRAPNATTENIPGLGLGLYICRQIADRHAGKLWAESAGEGQGATFILWLPSTQPLENVTGRT
ncbi:MAG: PAS domain-containing protein [Chloroflexi bacterium]|nr:PAS domain-containing protein [Chloroflexota bacterium]